MNRKQGLLLLFILLHFTIMILAQCPDRPGMPVLANQEAVDSFLAIYPNCTNYFEGYIAVNNVPVTWLYEDVQSYLLTLVGLLSSLLFLLSLLFKKIPYFNKQ